MQLRVCRTVHVEPTTGSALTSSIKTAGKMLLVCAWCIPSLPGVKCGNKEVQWMR